MGRRWHVTEFQKIVIACSAVAAIFLAAMALGGTNPWLLAAGGAVLGGTVVSVLVVAARRGAGRHEIATAKVISASDPPFNAGIKARCDMKLVVYLPGRGKVQTRLRDPSVPLERWPTKGQTFPVDVYGGNPHRRLHIRWDLVEQGMVRAPAPNGAASSGSKSASTPMWEEEQQPVVYSPTPPRPRKAQPQPTPPATAEAATPPPPPEITLHEEYSDPEGSPSRKPPPVQAAESRHPSTWHRRAPAGPDVANGHDPDGVDLADFDEPRLEPMALSDFDPAEVDRRDFGEEPPAVTVNPAHPAAPPVMPTDDPGPTTGSPPDPATATGIPAPRPAEPTVRTTPPGSGPRGGAGVDASLPVADLARSLRFYRDALGFAVAHTSSGSAIVEAEGIRILLDHVEDAAARTPRSGTIHLQVADIRATCDALRRRGVTLVEPPAAVNDGERMQLWRARLLDPDGHEITIIEWRHRR